MNQDTDIQNSSPNQSDPIPQDDIDNKKASGKFAYFFKYAGFEIAILLIIIIASIGILNYFKLVNFKKLLDTIPLNSSTSQKNNSSEFKIIWQNPGDTSGRSVLFTNLPIDKNYENYDFLNGKGWKVNQKEEKMAINGVFVKFEAVPNEINNKYITLSLPDDKTNLIKIRLTSLNSNKLKEKSFLTKTTVTNINKAENGSRNAIENLALIDFWSDKELNTIIKTGDAISIIILRDKKNEAILDENGSLIAESINLRRSEGEKAIKKEIGGKFLLSESPKITTPSPSSQQ